VNTIWCITIDCHSPFRHTSWVIHTSGHVLTIDVGRCLLKLDHVKRFSVLWLVLFKGRSLKRVMYCLQCLFSGILSWFFYGVLLSRHVFFLVVIWERSVLWVYIAWAYWSDASVLNFMVKWVRYQILLSSIYTVTMGYLLSCNNTIIQFNNVIISASLVI